MQSRSSENSTPTTPFEASGEADSQYTASVDPGSSPQFDGVTFINFWFLDDHLSTLRVDYESGRRWENTDEFAFKVTEKLRLPDIWASERDGSEKALAGLSGFCAYCRY
jgi:hypothetical protein